MTVDAHPPERNVPTPLSAPPAAAGSPGRALGDGGEQVLRERVGKALGVTAYVALMGLVNLGLLYIAPEGLPLLRLVFASALLWVSTIPMFLFIRNKPRQVPIFPVISILYFVYFGFPVFNETVLLKGRPYEVDDVTTAVALTLVGLIGMQVAFYSAIGKGVDLLPHLTITFDLERVAWYSLVTAVIGVGASAVVLSAARDLAPSLRAVANTVVRIPLLMLCGLFLLHLRGQLSFPLRVLGFLTYLAYLLLSLASGALAQVAWALLPMFFLYMVERAAIPWRAAVICFVLAMPFAHSKHLFRREVRNTYVGPIDRVALFLEITLDQMTSQGSRFAEVASKTTSERTSYLGTFAFVVNQTPRRIPYMNGETYRVVLWAFVPRVLAPDRPLQQLGQDFGHRYRLLNPNDHATSFNCAQIVEMYMNFGSLGVVAGMFLVGLYYRALYALFNHDEGGDGMLLVSAAALTGLLNIESDAANVLVGGFHSAAFCYLLLGILMFAANHVLVVRRDD
jgi:hypothetical protein